MFDGQSDSAVLRAIGLVVAVVALVGTTLLGWEFGEPSGTLPFAVGVACAAVAAAVWLRRR